MSRCRACRAEIVWAVTTNGKAIPVDPAADDLGNVRLTPRGDGGYSADVLGPLDRLLADGEELHMPHHATCPNVDDFR